MKCETDETKNSSPPLKCAAVGGSMRLFVETRFGLFSVICKDPGRPRTARAILRQAD